MKQGGSRDTGNAQGAGDATGGPALRARMHTAEHLLSAVMRRRFGSLRPLAAHLDGGRKGRCDYAVPRSPLDDEVAAVESEVRDLIERDLKVAVRFLPRDEASARFDLRAVPTGVETVRLVAVDGVDETPCSGAHVTSTAEVGGFRVASVSLREAGSVLRVRFRLDERPR